MLLSTLEKFQKFLRKEYPGLEEELGITDSIYIATAFFKLANYFNYNTPKPLESQEIYIDKFLKFLQHKGKRNLIFGHILGHRIYYSNSKEEWFFLDNDQPTSSTYKSRVCAKCNKPPTEEGHDPCLGTLPGVMNACCGHGFPESSYVQFSNNLIIRNFNLISQP